MGLELDRIERRCLIGLKAGRVVFDGPPAALTPAVLTDIYGEEDWSRTIRRVEDEAA